MRPSRMTDYPIVQNVGDHRSIEQVRLSLTWMRPPLPSVVLLCRGIGLPSSSSRGSRTGIQLDAMDLRKAWNLPVVEKPDQSRRDRCRTLLILHVQRGPLLGGFQGAVPSLSGP
jgi:hypothetical protein